MRCGSNRAKLGAMGAPELPPELAKWFTARGWRLRRHQAEMLEVAALGRHALLVADTGAGKTLTAFLAAIETQDGPRVERARAALLQFLDHLEQQSPGY